VVSAQPARRADRRGAPQPGARRAGQRRAPQPAARRVTPATIERRRCERHLRRRRRDLLEDLAGAVLLMALALVFTAGLGVIALLDIVVVGVLVGSVVVGRWLRARRR
jgi:hypothetical protein